MALKSNQARCCQHFPSCLIDKIEGIHARTGLCSHPVYRAGLAIHTPISFAGSGPSALWLSYRLTRYLCDTRLS
jgi:hypothetical protein